MSEFSNKIHFLGLKKPHPFIADYCMEKSLLFAEQNLDQKDYTHYREQLPKKSYFFTPTRGCYLFNSIHRSLAKQYKKRGRDFEKNMSNDYLEKIEQDIINGVKPVHYPLSVFL